MKRVEYFIIGVLMMIAVLAAVGVFSHRRAGKYSGFQVENAVNHLKIIASEPHSVLDSVPRATVRQYLFDRLLDMGGSPQIHLYDSIPFRDGGYVDIGNVYCSFEPQLTDAESYLLLVAHLDSRFPEQTPHGLVSSYGAADDGYGLAVILEVVREALSYAREWNQGLKVLYTDSEENNLDGVRCALERDNWIFDNVGLAINIEARGVKGPALMFETSAHNAALMDFYLDYARYPYTYSLTSAVYRIMPNYTDFTHLKSMFPGFNFSVIDNLDYYHNDKDNISNISTKSLAHYGAQISPMVREYLVNETYSDPCYFRAESDRIAFTIPSLGTVSLSNKASWIITISVFAVFLMVVVFYRGLDMITFPGLFQHALMALLASAAILAAGTAAVFLMTRIAHLPFSFTSVRYLPADTAMAIISAIALLTIYIGYYRRKAAKSKKFVYNHSLGILLYTLILSVTLQIIIGENLFLMLPVMATLIGLIFNIFGKLKLISLPALLFLIPVCVPFLYNLYTALTVGALGLVLFLMYLYLTMGTAMMTCLTNKSR